MNEIISTIVANGIWAVMFCGLLVFELSDSRRREARYTLAITELSERLGVVNDIKSDTEAIKTDLSEVKADTEAIKLAPTRGKKRAAGGGGEPCPAT